MVNDADIDDNISWADSSPDHQVHVNTVHQNFESHTKKQVQQAERTRRLMSMVASSSERNFQAMIHLNMLKDCPVTNDDIHNAHDMYGSDLTSIRGKMVWWKPERVVTDYVEIPPKKLLIQRRVTLVANVMFENSISCLVSASCNIDLITIEHASPPRSASRLGALLQKIVWVYAWACFPISTILMDYKFELVSDHVPVGNINTTAAAEYVGEVEQKICVDKECARGIICTLPFKTFP